jgi:hypothetical protein
MDRALGRVDKQASAAGLSLKSVAGYAAGFIGFTVLYSQIRKGVRELAEFELGLANVSTMLDDQTRRYLPKYRDELERLWFV